MFNTNDLRKKLHVLWNRHCLTVFALVAVVGTSYAAMNHADALYILTGMEDSAIVLDDETDTADLSLAAGVSLQQQHRIRCDPDCRSAGTDHV